MPLSPGSALGPYRIEELIASGGMGEVYKARHSQLERWVAIKVIRESASEDPVALERFHREAKSASRLQHPNVCRVYDFGQDGDRWFLVLEYLEGETLRDRMKRQGLSVPEIYKLGAEIADALDHAHSHGLVHRDLKPSNVMLTKSGAKILDFGVAKRSDPGLLPSSDEGSLLDTNTLTTDGAIIGTLPYMAPEQVGGEESDARTDIHAFGVVLYEVLTEQRPFKGRTPAALAVDILQGTPQPITELQPEAPVQLSKVVDRCLEKDPADRWQTAGDLADEFRWITTSRGAAPLPAAPKARRKVRAGWIGVPVTLAVLALLGWAFGLMGPGQGPGFVDRPESVVVVPFHTSTSSERERRLVDELADEITRELTNWESIRAVPRVSFAGPMFDLGLTGPTLERVEDGIALAGAVSAQVLAVVTLRLRGDSAFAETTLFSTRSGQSVGNSFLSSGSPDDPLTLVAPLAYGILGIESAVGAPDRLMPGTRDPDALVAQLLGKAELGQWRLTEAEEHFRRAVELDSTYAVALSHLAQTLYWQGAEPGQSDADAGREITRWSTAAIGHLGEITRQDELHVRGFYAFQQGDYVGARGLYSSILEIDPTDVYAWLMSGTVEFVDPWLTEGPEGALTPRADFNRAWSAFSEAVRLQPTFQLGYGHIFDIYEDLERPLAQGSCSGFEVPRNETLAPWQARRLDQLMAFCLVISDTSFRWVPPEVLSSLDHTVLEAGADLRLRESITILERWAAFSQDEPRPRERLAQVLIGQRARTNPGAPQRLQDLANSALDHLSAALALKSDTLVRDLAQLAQLRLASGAVDDAAELTMRALEESAGAGLGESGPPPRGAGNLFVALGQTSDALRVVSLGDGSSVFIPDPVSGGLISYAGAEPLVERIQVLGATGVIGERLHIEVRALLDLWANAGYTPRQQELLRNQVTPLIVAALLQDPDALRSWAPSVTVDDPTWRALVGGEPDPAEVRTLVQRANADGTADGMSDATRYFVLATLASRAGESRLSARLYSRLDSIPYALDSNDMGWGLQSLSRLLRAEEYEILGESERALEQYSTFITVWTGADSLVAPLIERARLGLARVTR